MLLETTTDTSRDLFFNVANEQTILEELGPLFKDGLANELTYAMGEFILRLPLLPYYYRETLGGDGQKHLTSPGFGPTDMLNHYGQPYLIKSGLAVNSPEAMECLFEQMPMGEAGKNRDAAEAKGFAQLRRLIFDSPDNTLFGWISPPINPDGYSFTYFGQVKPAKNGRYVEMAACRNYLTPENHHQFLKAWGKNLKPGLPGNRAEDFLLSPFALNLSEQKLLGIHELSDMALFLYTFDPQSPQTSELNFSRYQQVLDQVKQKAVRPHLDKFISLLIQGADKPQIDALLDEIELAAVKASLPELTNQSIWETTDERDWDLQATAFLAFSRKEMPKDGGSCPAVNRRNDLVTSINELMNALSDNEDESQKCENCGQIRKESPDAGCCKGCRYK